VTSGKVWTVSGASANQQCSNSVPLSTSNDNPLSQASYGIGSFTQLFTSYTYDYNNFRFVDRQTIRGVQADHYRGQFYNVEIPNPNLYSPLFLNYTTEIYLFPVGWSYPGRSSSSDARLPLRIVNWGNQLNASSQCITFGCQYPRNAFFQDYYNIFEMLPQSASDVANWFPAAVPSASNCQGFSLPSSNQQPSSSSSSSLSGGAIAGIVIAVLVVVIILIAANCCLVRGRYGDSYFKEDRSKVVNANDSDA